MTNYRKTLFNLLNRLYPADMANENYSDFCRDYFFCASGDTLRLRHVGLRFFENYFDCYQVSWPEEIDLDKIPAKHLIWLATHCKSLYYIGTKQIFLFDQEEAFLFQLLDADLDDVAKSGGM